MSEFTVWEERMIALGGVCLAAVCAQQLARRGEIQPQEHSDVMIHALLEMNPASTEAVFGDLSALKPALRLLRAQLSGEGAKDVEQTRYVVGMLALERRLVRNNQALEQLGRGLQQINRQQKEFDFEPNLIIENAGKLYMDAISPLGPRIQISGKPEHLKQAAVQFHIRTMLLAGIRCAVLWRQLGGKRRQAFALTYGVIHEAFMLTNHCTVNGNNIVWLSRQILLEEIFKFAFTDKTNTGGVFLSGGD